MISARDDGRYQFAALSIDRHKKKRAAKLAARSRDNFKPDQEGIRAGERR
jgi:hypothetical protein